MKERLDILLVERRLTESRMKAQWLIRNKCVMVNGRLVEKPGKKIDNSANIWLTKKFPYVGKGGLKLEKALKEFLIPVEGKVCVDVGSSVGGFTDCLIKHGAKTVYSIDTATDLLHPSLICNDRVKKLLGQDIRKIEHLPEKASIITIDVTFSSLREILPRVRNLVYSDGDIIVLVKPQFETNFYEKNSENFNNPRRIKMIVSSLINWCQEHQLFVHKCIKSPNLGKTFSFETLLHIKLE